MDGRDCEASASRLADTKQAGGKRRRWPEELKREIVAADGARGLGIDRGPPPRRERQPAVQMAAAVRGGNIFSRPGAVAAGRDRALRSPTVEERGGSPPVSPAPPAGSIEIALRGGTRSGSGARWIRRRWRRRSVRCWRPAGAGDPASGGHAGLAGDRPHRHAQGLERLALQVQEVLRRDPYGGHLFVFRGRRGDLIKILWHDSQGMCLFMQEAGARAGSSGPRRPMGW